MKQERPGVEHEELALALIRDWQAYLRAQQALARPPASADPFEASDADTERLQAATLLRALPAERRRLFDAAIAERQEYWRSALEADVRIEQSVHAALVDPDRVDAEALQECLQLAAGHQHPNGAGYVRYPAAATEPITWYDAFVPQLAAPPSDSAYEIAMPRTDRRRIAARVLAGFALVPLLGWLVWMLAVPAGGDAVPQTEARVNDSALAGWSSGRVVLRGDTSTPALALHNVTTPEWPSDGLAYQRRGVGLPLRICVPQEALEGVTALELAGDGATPDRVYALDSEPAPDDALVVVACDNPSSVRFGTLQETRPASLGAPGTRYEIEHASIELRSVAVEGASQNPSLPGDVAQVTLDVSVGRSELDWVALAPTLRIADGRAYTGPQVESRQGGATLRYLVALPREALDAEWRIGTAEGGTIARWAVTLQPPPDRDALLRQYVHVPRVVAENADTLRVTLQYTGLQPLVLDVHDMRLEQADVVLPPPDVTGVETALAPGETRDVVVSLPPDIPGTLTFSVGSSSFRIER